MNRAQAITRLHQIVDGIDADDSESDAGWWETSDGSTFGAEKLRLLEELVHALTKS